MSERSEKNITTIVGENITAQRKRLGISQKDLAARLGITVDAMVRMEKGRIAPKMSRLQDIADNLQCSVAFLFIRETDMPDEFAKQISDILKPLPTEGQEALLDLMTVTAKLMQGK